MGINSVPRASAIALKTSGHETAYSAPGMYRKWSARPWTRRALLTSDVVEEGRRRYCLDGLGNPVCQLFLNPACLLTTPNLTRY